MTERTVTVNYVARVEGEGALRVRIEQQAVKEVELRIFEPPRFFEAFLRGRSYLEAPDITSRICGICPVAYQMSASHALERIAGIEVRGPLRNLRRLLYAGEWIESHALHIFLLHLPDFLGFPDAVHMAEKHPEVVRQGLELKRVGNQVMEVLGGRAIHPINPRIGGFYRCPNREEVQGLEAPLEVALTQAEATARFVATLPFPNVEEDYDFVSLRHPEEYPMNEGRIVSSSGLDVPFERFEEEFHEQQVPWSNALQSRTKEGRTYLVGPLARFALNRDRLTPKAAALARELQAPAPVRNPFQAILVRSLEVVVAIEEALRIVRSYHEPPEPFLSPQAPFRGGVGRWATEAPRGLLYHRYEVGADGIIREAKIVPPTAQNQARIEQDVRHLVERSVGLGDAQLQDACERAIRNHDPCISCATHFLQLDLQRD